MNFNGRWSQRFAVKTLRCHNALLPVLRSTTKGESNGQNTYSVTITTFDDPKALMTIFDYL